MAEPRLYQIQSERWQVGLLPSTGAAIAFGRLRHNDRWLDFFRSTGIADYGKVSDCASFPLIPYSNRIRDRRFQFRGKTYELRPNKPDGTVQHGVGRDLPWKVERADEASVTVLLTSTDFADLNFPFRVSARIEYRVQDHIFSIQTGLTNDDSQVMPAGFGHHPYFQRTLAGEDDVVSLEIPYDEYFELDSKSLPVGEPRPISERLDFRKPRALGTVELNDCLTSKRPNQAVSILYSQSGERINLEFDPIFANLIVFAPAGKSFFAIEPVSNANDGFNLYAAGVRNSGVFELEPGQTQTGTIRFIAQ